MTPFLKRQGRRINESKNPYIKIPCNFSDATKKFHLQKEKKDVATSQYHSTLKNQKKKKTKIDESKGLQKVFPPGVKLQFVLDIGCATILLANRRNETEQPAAATSRSVRGCQQVAGWPRIDFLRIQPGSQL